MRRSIFVLLALLVSRLAMAQDSSGAGVRVTTALHDDGSRTVTQIDSENHTSEACTYSHGDKLIRKVTYTLDDQNDPLQGIVYDGKGRALYKAVYKRNAMGRVSEEVEYTMDDRLLGRFVYRYDANGRLLKIDTYDAEGNLVNPTGATSGSKQSLPRRNR